MKKVYEIPEIEVQNISVEDEVTSGVGGEWETSLVTE